MLYWAWIYWIFPVFAAFLILTIYWLCRFPFFQWMICTWIFQLWRRINIGTILHLNLLTPLPQLARYTNHHFWDLPSICSQYKFHSISSYVVGENSLNLSNGFIHRMSTSLPDLAFIVQPYLSHKQLLVGWGGKSGFTNRPEDRRMANLFPQKPVVN